MNHRRDDTTHGATGGVADGLVDAGHVEAGHVEAGHVEAGRTGRIAYARIAPNQDLVTAVLAVCAQHGFAHAIVRGSLGSLVDACLHTRNGQYLQISGPAVEIISLAGEVRPAADGAPQAMLTGVVADPDGRVHGGPFVAGHNTVCMTFELTLEEWLPET